MSAESVEGSFRTNLANLLEEDMEHQEMSGENLEESATCKRPVLVKLAYIGGRRVFLKIRRPCHVFEYIAHAPRSQAVSSNASEVETPMFTKPLK
jgi:hypothetical protein